jgi:hypothetical protein
MRSAPPLGVFTVLGCAPANGPESSTTRRASLERSAEYDAAIAAPDAIVSTREPASPSSPAGVRAIGFYADAKPDEVIDRITSFREWPSVLANEEPVFESATVTADATTDGVREIMLSLVIHAPERPRLELVVTVSPNAARSTVIYAENRVAVSLSPSDTVAIVHAGDLQVDAVIGAYTTGTIVDATMKVQTTGAFLDSLAGPVLAPILPALIRWSRTPR